MSAIEQMRALENLYTRQKTIPDIVVRTHGYKLENVAGNLQNDYQWNDKTFIPLSYWNSIMTLAMSVMRCKKDVNTTDKQTALKLAVSSIMAWRFTQGIYRFDEYTYSAILNSKSGARIQLKNIQNIPEWCIYIETPTLTFKGQPLEGVFIQRNCTPNSNPNNEPDILIITFDVCTIYDKEKNKLNIPPCVVLKTTNNIMIKEAVLGGYGIFDANEIPETLSLFGKIISLLNAITDPIMRIESELLINLKPSFYNVKSQVVPSKDHVNHIRISAPSNPRIWYIGMDFGVEWRSALHRQRLDSTQRAIGLSWVNSTDVNGNTEFSLRAPYNLNYALPDDINNLLNDWQNDGFLCEDINNL